MANPEHVELVKRGAAAIAEWRRKHPGERLHLFEANLSGADLSGANLSGANLSGAVLVSADLSGAVLAQADLSDANLFGADLVNANLFGAVLSEADLVKANLSGAVLVSADLSGADFTGASLSEADLRGANLTMSHLRETQFAQATCGFTVLGDCDLTQCHGLDTVRHEHPSSIDINTLLRTARAGGGGFSTEVRTFLLGAGVPKELLDAIPSIVREIKYNSCFIAYGAPDEEFARKLDEALKVKGVNCWFFPESKKGGRPVLDAERKSRQSAEKVVLVCSGAGLEKPGVKREIDETCQEDPKKLIPAVKDREWLRDAYRIERDGRDLKPCLRSQTWVEFDRKLYEDALEDLLKALEKKRPSPKTRGKRKARAS